MSLKSKIIICDLDNTLCNAAWRQSFAQRKEWDEFHRLAKYDEPNWAILKLLERESKHDWITIMFITGRPEAYRSDTNQWLEKWGFKDHLLVMRADGDFESDFIYKRIAITEHIADLDDVLYALEDRDAVVEMLRSLGIACFQVQKGAY